MNTKKRHECGIVLTGILALISFLFAVKSEEPLMTLNATTFYYLITAVWLQGLVASIIGWRKEKRTALAELQHERHCVDFYHKLRDDLAVSVNSWKKDVPPEIISYYILHIATAPYSTYKEVLASLGVEKCIEMMLLNTFTSYVHKANGLKTSSGMESWGNHVAAAFTLTGNVKGEVQTRYCGNITTRKDK